MAACQTFGQIISSSDRRLDIASTNNLETNPKGGGPIGDRKSTPNATRRREETEEVGRAREKRGRKRICEKLAATAAQNQQLGPQSGARGMGKS